MIYDAVFANIFANIFLHLHHLSESAEISSSASCARRWRQGLRRLKAMDSRFRREPLGRHREHPVEAAHLLHFGLAVNQILRAEA